MSSELILGGALANCGRDAPRDEFLELLLRETPDLAIFRLRPRTSLTDVRAALDWQAILGTSANLLALAGVLWKAYERYVKPRPDRTDKTAKPFLVINIRRSDGKFVQFILGNEHKTRRYSSNSSRARLQNYALNLVPKKVLACFLSLFRTRTWCVYISGIAKTSNLPSVRCYLPGLP